MSTSERYAIYYAPPEELALADLGARWLGRDATTGARLDRPAVDGLSPERAEALTESPRFYGFHGTIKAPFTLAAGVSAEDLTAAVDRFAATRAVFPIPPLMVAPLGGFVALVPSAPSNDLMDLASACVETFHAVRAPANAAEVERRRAAGLTPGQQALLERWGYPYVMSEFHFHMTLTGRIEDDGERGAVIEALRRLFAPVTDAPLEVDGLAVFHQPDRETPFRLVHRARFLTRTAT